MDKNYKQLCVLQGCIFGDDTKEDFEKHFLDLGFRVKFAEQVITNGSVERNEEGGRSDILFYIHNDDIEKFAIPRLSMDIRWWEDVVSYNNNSYLYSEEILEKYPVRW